MNLSDLNSQELRDLIKEAEKQLVQKTTKVPKKVIAKLSKTMTDFQEEGINCVIPIEFKFKLHVTFYRDDVGIMNDYFVPNVEDMIENDKLFKAKQDEVEKKWNKFVQEVKVTAIKYDVDEQTVWSNL